MQNVLFGLSALHRLAEGRGDGLIPELLELVQREEKIAQQGVIPLSIQPVSSGPALQTRYEPSDDDTNVTVLQTESGVDHAESAG